MYIYFCSILKFTLRSDQKWDRYSQSASRAGEQESWETLCECRSHFFTKGALLVTSQGEFEFSSLL